MKNEKISIPLLVQGEVMFSNLVTPKQNLNGQDYYGIVIKVEKGSPEAKKLSTGFNSFFKEANLPKTSNKKSGVSQKEYVSWYVKDGDKDQYWSEFESNKGHLILTLKAPKPAKTYLKKGKSFIPVDKKEVNYSDKVLTVSHMVKSKTPKGMTYVALFLSEVLITEKGSSDFEGGSSLIAKETGLSFGEGSEELKSANDDMFDDNIDNPEESEDPDESDDDLPF